MVERKFTGAQICYLVVKVMEGHWLTVTPHLGKLNACRGFGINLVHWVSTCTPGM